MHKKKEIIQNITKKPIDLPYTHNGKQIMVHIAEASVAELDGKQEILDLPLLEYLTEQIGKAISNCHSRYISLPSDVYIGQADASMEDKPKEEAGFLASFKPKYSLEQVALPKETMASVTLAVNATKHREKLAKQWGLSDLMNSRSMILNFYGKPGTGKTMAAEAVAASLQKKCLKINYAQLESKYVGETPKNIQKAFEIAKREDAVLIFDEADSFLGKRLTEVKQSADYGVNITRSVLLMELEQFDGIVVFTTNLLKNYDSAFERRIFMSLEFPMPDEATREKIWTLHLPNALPLSEEVSPQVLAKTYEGLSGADIRDMVFMAALHACEKNEEKVSLQDCDYAYDTIRSRYAKEQEIRIVSRERITQEQYDEETGTEGH